jgi:hypothetical protein
MYDNALLEAYSRALQEELDALNRLKSRDISADDVIDFERKFTHKSWAENLSLLNSLEIGDDNELLFPEGSELISFDITEEYGIYHLKADRLIYKNPAIYDDKFLWTQNKKKITSLYRLAMLKATNKTQIQPFTEPVMVLFVQHFENKKEFIDLDNFSTKVFIDTVLVKGGLINDDSPDFITELSVANCKSDKSFTEVFIGSKEKILERIR